MSGGGYNGAAFIGASQMETNVESWSSWCTTKPR